MPYTISQILTPVSCLIAIKLAKESNNLAKLYETSEIANANTTNKPATAAIANNNGGNAAPKALNATNMPTNTPNVAAGFS